MIPEKIPKLLTFLQNNLVEMNAVLQKTNREELPPTLLPQITKTKTIVVAHAAHCSQNDTLIETMADDFTSLIAIFSQIDLDQDDEVLGAVLWRKNLHSLIGNFIGNATQLMIILRAQGLVPSAIQDLPLDIAVNDYAGQVRALQKRVEALDAGFKTFQAEVENQKTMSADQSQIQNFGLINFSNSKIKIQINILNNLTQSHNKIDLKALARALEHLAKAVKGVGTAIRKFPQQISGALVKAYDATLKPLTTKVVHGGKTLFKWVVRQVERLGRSVRAPSDQPRDPRGVLFADKWWPWETMEIYVAHNENITDITPLKDLTNLQRLGLDNTKITDITPLKNLINLQELGLSSTKITDITPLKDLTNLQRLYLHNTKITDITPLKGLANLQELSLSSTNITDITPLKDLTNLQRLGLGNTNITDITPLKDLTNLQALYLHDTKITDITPLKDLINLRTLSLSNTNITDITSLKDLTNLQVLWLRNTNITDITPLKDLTNLQRLWLSQTSITDITPLKGLTNLQELGLPDGTKLEGQPAIQKAIKTWRPKRKSRAR